MINSLRNGLLAAALCALGLLAPVPAHAGDTAELNILGFSPDGGIFAFEEYGVQDASGFPYANRFYIDTQTDEFIPGSPVRVRIDDEKASLAAARDEARKRGEKVVSQEVLEANRGFTAAFNAVTEVSADPKRIVAYPLPYFPPIGAALEFRLEQFKVETPYDRCYDLGELHGFRLIQIDKENGDQPKILHEDKSVPESRGCATGYRLSGLQTFGPYSLTAFAVIIAVERLGFEGPDYRWIAVTGRP
jgi:predicted secreted protein